MEILRLATPCRNVPVTFTLTMSHRRLHNLPLSRQMELSRQYPWLKDVHTDDPRTDVKILSISVFDHWLSREDACRLLENVPPFEQARREACHAQFCGLLVRGTSVLSFTFRRRRGDRLVFREFTSQAALSSYCTPNGARSFGGRGTRHFHVALPDLNCVFYEGWDDTHHFFFTDSTSMGPLHKWASQSGLYLLQNG